MSVWNQDIRTMWPFKRKSISQGGAGIFFPTVSEPFMASTYEMFAAQGYGWNSTVNTCVRLVGRSIGGLPVKIFRDEIVNGEAEEVFIDNHPAWRFIGERGKPNDRQSWPQFVMAYFAYAYLAGNNYMFAAGDVNNPGMLFLLRPDRVKPIFAKDGTVIEYEHNVNGKIQTIPAEQILHTKTFNPLDDHTGMALLRPATVEIDQDNKGKLWNLSLLKNSARPSIFIAMENGPPSPEQAKQLKIWSRENLQGEDNAGGVVIVPGAKLTEVGLTPKDMDWLKGSIQAKVAIANVCGVPPELIGIQEQKTYSNYQEARKAFYEETIIPLADDFFSSLTLFLAGKFGSKIRPVQDGVIIAVDKSKVQALQESQDSLHKRLREDIKGGLFTTNESRKELAFDEVDGGDQILVPQNVVPLELITDGDIENEILPENQPTPEEDEDEDEENNDEDI